MDFSIFQEGTTVPAGPGAVDVTGGQPVVPGQNFASVMSGPMGFEEAHVPASTPQEVEERRNGWLKIWEKFQSNPNLQRALMLVGAQLTQPIQPGQTTSGAIAQSAVVGMNAYQLGQKEQLALEGAQRKEAREENRLGMEEERLGLERERFGEAKKTGETQRAATAAGTKRTLLDIETAELTQKDTVTRGHALAEKAVQEAAEFKDEAGLRRAERALREQEARIKASIPDEVRQQAELDRVNELREKVRLVGAQATKAGHEATIAGQEAGMSPAERARLKTTTTTTAEGAKWALLENAWKSSPQLQRQHPDMSAWLANATTSVRENPAVTLKAVSEAIDALPTPRKGTTDPDREKLEGVRRDLINRIAGGNQDQPSAPPVSGAQPAAAKGKPGSSAENPLPWPGAQQAGRLPSGTYIIGPDGKLLRKK